MFDNAKLKMAGIEIVIRTHIEGPIKARIFLCYLQNIDSVEGIQFRALAGAELSFGRIVFSHKISTFTLSSAK